MKENINIKRAVEAILFLATEPLSSSRLEKLTEDLDHAGKSMTVILNELIGEYEEEEKGFFLVRVANGYQFKTRDIYAPWVRKLFKTRRVIQLSNPTLETLAIIAYKQPITRIEIELIRGVNVEGILRNLLDMELIKISGQKEVAGRPYIYRTSRRFLEHFGLNSLSDLPPLEKKEKPSAKKISTSSDLKSEGGGPSNRRDQDESLPPENESGSDNKN